MTLLTSLAGGFCAWLVLLFLLDWLHGGFVGRASLSLARAARLFSWHGLHWLLCMPGFFFALLCLSGGKFPPGPPKKKKKNTFYAMSVVGLSFSCTAKTAKLLLQKLWVSLPL